MELWLDSVERRDIRSIVGACNEDMQKLEGNTIFISGASGFLARYLVETILDRSREGLEGSTLLMASRDLQKLAEIFGERLDSKVVRLIDSSRPGWETEVAPRCDYIVHCASPSDPSLCSKDPNSTMTDMLESTKQVIELARRSNSRRLLYLSSGAVYGKQPPSKDFLSETQHFCRSSDGPEPCYADAKRACEALLNSSGVPIIIARGFSFLGPHQNLGSSFAVPDFINQASIHGSIRIRGDGRAIRSYCYEADATIIMWGLLLRDLTYDVYNFGSDRFLTSIADLAELVSKNMGNVPITIEGRPEEGLPPRYVPDCSRQREVHEPRVSLEVGLARTIESMRERGLIKINQALPAPKRSKAD
jgi:nucleoside-diphosphate-sugar epimerase